MTDETSNSPDKFAWQRAVAASDLPSSARHVGHVLCMLADAKTAVIPVKFTPSLTRLAELTGLDRTTVARQLKVLEGGGWVGRTRPAPAAARSKKERTRYRLTVPSGGTVPLDEQGMSDAPGLGGGTVPPEVVAENPPASGTEPHNQSGDRRRSIKKIERDLDLHRRKDPDQRIVATLLEVTGKTIPTTWVPKVRRAIFGGDGTPGPDVKDPPAYADKAIRNEPNPVTRFLPTPEPPRLERPTPPEPAEPTPPHRHAPDSTPDEPTAPPMTDDERRAMAAEALRKARECRQARQRPAARTPPPRREATDDDKADQERQIAVFARYRAALDGGMSHEDAERHARGASP